MCIVVKSKTYILRSTLASTLIAKMNVPLPLPGTQDDDEERERRNDDAPPDSGALLRWEKADPTPTGHIALLGIRTLVLSLILCLGRAIQDGEPSQSSSLEYMR
jgi:hypothetical protein